MSKLEDAYAVLCALVLEDGRPWGEAAVGWQREDARAILDVESSVRFHYLTRPRGASKTADLAGVTIAALLEQLAAKSRSYALAADRGQASLLIDSIDGYVSRTAGLGGALLVENFKVTARRSGATLEVLAADESSSWGIRPSFLIVDEFAQWKTTPGPRRLWRAVFSALPKVPGSRLVILTSAGDPAHPSYSVLQRALGRPAQWRVHEVPGPVPWIAPRELEEQRVELPEWDYARLHLNQWTGAEDRLASVDDVRACVTLAGPLTFDSRWRYVIGVDLGLKHDRTVATVCHLEPLFEQGGSQVGARVVLDRIEVWAGSRKFPVRLEDVEAWLVQAADSFGHPEIVIDPWQAVGLAQRLRDRGNHVTEFAFSPQSVGRLGSTLHLLLRNHSLALPDDPDLVDELTNVRLRETSPGVLRIDHDPDRHDDRAIALALAATHLLDGFQGPPAFVSSRPTDGFPKYEVDDGPALMRQFGDRYAVPDEKTSAAMERLWGGLWRR